MNQLIGLGAMPMGQSEPQGTTWWSQRTATEKWIVVGVATLGAVSLLTILSNLAHPSYTSNLVGPKSMFALPRVRRRLGRKSAPKKYRRLGATKRSDYAYPQGFAYPVVFRTHGRIDVAKSRRHVASAKGRFTQFKHRYDPAVRKIIAKNINRAAKRFGLRADVRP